LDLLHEILKNGTDHNKRYRIYSKVGMAAPPNVALGVAAGKRTAYVLVGSVINQAVAEPIFRYIGETSHKRLENPAVDIAWLCEAVLHSRQLFKTKGVVYENQ
jgi:hypothetical protein